MKATGKSVLLGGTTLVICYTIYKSKENIWKYLRYCLDSYLDLGTPSSSKEKVITEYLMIPNEAVSYILGKHGENILNIERQTKVFLRVVSSSWNIVKEEPKESEQNPMFDNNLLDYGDNSDMKSEKYYFVKMQSLRQENIHLALVALKSLLTQYHEVRDEDKIEVPAEAVGHVIGVRGCHIRNICKVNKVQIRIENCSNSSAVFHLYGPTERVSIAKDLICRRIRFSKNISIEEEIQQAKQEISHFEIQTGNEWW